MKIVCLVKFVPDIDNFTYDYERNVIVRDNTRLILNPDDAAALGFALMMKKKHEAKVHIVSMGPLSIKDKIYDLIRRGVDSAALISDRAYSGSDTFVTAMILGRYLEKVDRDMVLTGSHSMDGDTAHIPSQIAELLDMNVMCNISHIDEDICKTEKVVCEVEQEGEILTLGVPLPAVLGMTKESKYKLPFVKYENLDKDVSEKLDVITNKELKFREWETGIPGSKTKVVSTYVRQMDRKEQTVITNNDEGIEYVYQYLKEKGFV